MSPSAKCSPGCACKRHRKVGNKCQPGCTCGRHANRFSVICVPGCTCSKHKKHPPGCDCGIHTQSDEMKMRNAAAQRRRWENVTLAERIAFGEAVTESMAQRGLVHRDEKTRAYHRNHMRVAASHGKAREQSCELCGDQGYEWSQIHGTDGTDPHAHYRSLCHPCHTKYDTRGEV